MTKTSPAQSKDPVERMAHFAQRVIDNDGGLSAHSSMDLDYALDELERAAQEFLRG